MFLDVVVVQLHMKTAALDDLLCTSLVCTLSSVNIVLWELLARTLRLLLRYVVPHKLSAASVLVGLL